MSRIERLPVGKTALLRAWVVKFEPYIRSAPYVITCAVASSSPSVSASYQQRLSAAHTTDTRCGSTLQMSSVFWLGSWHEQWLPPPANSWIGLRPWCRTGISGVFLPRILRTPTSQLDRGQLFSAPLTLGSQLLTEHQLRSHPGMNVGFLVPTCTENSKWVLRRALHLKLARQLPLSNS